MPIRPKTKRRLLTLLAIFVSVSLVVIGAYRYREKQIRQNQAIMRKEAHDLFMAGDFQGAANVLKDYTRQLPDDADALLMYAQAEQNLPNGSSTAIDALHQYLDLNPSNIDAEHHLLALEMAADQTDQANDLS
jgi:thioredoxin-like negative regulator of GroEL